MEAGQIPGLPATRVRTRTRCRACQRRCARWRTSPFGARRSICPPRPSSPGSGRAFRRGVGCTAPPSGALGFGPMPPGALFGSTGGMSLPPGGELMPEPTERPGTHRTSVGASARCMPQGYPGGRLRNLLTAYFEAFSIKSAVLLISSSTVTWSWKELNEWSIGRVQSSPGP